MRPFDVFWYCSTCGESEPAEWPYEIGDKEPCITCPGDPCGTAVVVTLEEKMARESARNEKE